jgi:hypothetical protein
MLMPAQPIMIAQTLLHHATDVASPGNKGRDVGFAFDCRMYCRNEVGLHLGPEDIA